MAEPPNDHPDYRVEIVLESTSNLAFEVEGEVSRILGTVPGKIGRQLLRSEALCTHDEDDDILRDVYGNRVGTVRLIQIG